MGLDIPAKDYTLAFYFSLVHYSFVTRCCMVAGWVWVVYDWIITLEEERVLVWARPKGIKSKLFYAFVRYYGIALLTSNLVVQMKEWSPTFCHTYFYVLGIGGLCLLFAVEAALQVRVYVLYSCSVKLAILNAVLFAVEVASMLTFLMLDTVRYQPIQTPPGLTGCWSGSISLNQNWTKYMWYFAAAYETYLSVLVGYAGWNGYRLTHSWGLLGVLVRDSMIWFVALMVTMIFNAVAWTINDPQIILLGIPILHSCCTIGGARLLLNLRHAAIGLHDDGNTTGERTTAKFATVRSNTQTTNTMHERGLPVYEKDEDDSFDLRDGAIRMNSMSP